MSALGHFIEEEGIATVAIALIRPQAERTRPPRALWVPFELGRPLGPPSDPEFQRRVILAALWLLERKDGPVLLVDFPDDDPREAADHSWHSPRTGGARGDLAAALEAEIAELAPAYRQSCAERGRTTVGLTSLTPTEAASYVAAWLRGPPPSASPVAELSPVLCLRFAVDDLKAYALEAAIAGGAKPSSKQLGDWLWNDSAIGAAVRALRVQLMASDDERAKLIGTMFMVPGVRAAS
ncbi:MAG TPA: hypothetical protein VHU15_01185 [Stellaceae bacterium]|nr:hypothetical protein [Stellaceae bacterium]